MLLCEEYAQRHRLRKPFVRYVNSGCLFLDHKRREHDADWLVLSFYWEEHSVHPGKYEIRYGVPCHNGEEELFFFPWQNSVSLSWDRYEDYLLNVISRCRKDEAVCDPLEVTLLAWNFFLVSHDNWFSRKVHSDLLYETVDPGLSVSSRFLAFQRILSCLSESHQEVYSTWRRDMMDYLRNYAYWLGELVAAHGK